MKAITPDNYLVRPFRTNKTWNFDYTFLGGGNSSSVRIDLASAPSSTWLFSGSSGYQNVDGIYSQQLYKSVQHTFYTGSRTEQTGSRYIPVTPRNKKYYPTGSNFYVVNIEQQTFGEKVRPGTFLLTSPSSTASISDDGYGRLISSLNTSSVIGNIFYTVGVAIIKQDTGSYSGSLVTDRGLYLTTGSVVNVQYGGLHTIYEHQVMCTVQPGELNFTTNPTMKLNTLSGTFSGGSTFTQQTGSVASDLVLSGTLDPYFTTLGLYNDVGEMVAVAKLPRAIRRITNTEQTVIVRFDA